MSYLPPSHPPPKFDSDINNQTSFQNTKTTDELNDFQATNRSRNSMSVIDPSSLSSPYQRARTSQSNLFLLPSAANKEYSVPNGPPPPSFPAMLDNHNQQKNEQFANINISTAPMTIRPPPIDSSVQPQALSQNGPNYQFNQQKPTNGYSDTSFIGINKRPINASSLSIATTPYQYALSRQDQNRSVDPSLLTGTNPISGNNSNPGSNRKPVNGDSSGNLSTGSSPRNWSTDYHGGSNPASPRRGNARIDPAQMPRPTRPNIDVTYQSRSGASRKVPPSVNTLYTAIDTGNAIPRYMRSSMVAPPSTSELLSQIGIPFSVLVTPFAVPENDEIAVPLVNFGLDNNNDEIKKNPPRCNRCHGYINSSVSWIEEGNAWCCNLCGMHNSVEPWYYSPLDGAGLRMDRLQRPELQLGSVDFLVDPSDYSIRNPQQPIYVFAIDISEKALSNGVTLAGIRATKTALKRLIHYQKNIEIEQKQQENYQIDSKHHPMKPNVMDSSATTKTGGIFGSIYSKVTETNKIKLNVPTSGAMNHTKSTKESRYESSIKVGIITFDRQIQYYRVKSSEELYRKDGSTSLDPIELFVNGDPYDPFPPLPISQWLHSLGDASGLDGIQLLLNKLPELITAMQDMDTDGYVQKNVQTPYSNGQPPQSFGNCCTAAIKCVQQSLITLGGRLYVMTSSQANIGYGEILPTARADNSTASIYGTVAEISLYSTATRQMNSTSNPEEKVLCGLYNQLGKSCAESKIAVNIILCIGEQAVVYGGTGISTPPPQVDGMLLSELTELTGGRWYAFTGEMNEEDNVHRFEEQLVHNIESHSVGANEATVKVRSSLGVAIEEVISGPSGIHSNSLDEIELSGMDSDTSFCVLLKHDYDGGGVVGVATSTAEGMMKKVTSGILSKATSLATTSQLHDEDKIHIQFAVLYTSPLTRQRIVRVHNLCLISTSKHVIVFRNCDVEAVAASVLKIGLARALKVPLFIPNKDNDVSNRINVKNKGPRAYIDIAVTNALQNYRMHCSGQSPKGQLILPESLKVFPLYALSMLKHPALLENGSYISGGILATSSSGNLLSNNPGNISNNSPPRDPFDKASGNNGSSSGLRSLSQVNVRGYERAFEIRKLLSLPVKEVINSLYPRMYSLLSLFSTDSMDEFDQSVVNALALSSTMSSSRGYSPHSRSLSVQTKMDGQGHQKHFILPSQRSRSFDNSLDNPINGSLDNPDGPTYLSSPVKNTIKTLCSLTPTSELLESDQIFLLDDRCSYLWIFIGRNVPEATIMEIFDVNGSNSSMNDSNNNYGTTQSNKFTVTSSYYARPQHASFNHNTDLGHRIATFIRHIQSSSPYKPEVQIIWADLGNNPLIKKFTRRLVEDSINGKISSYVDYLCNMHVKIVTEISKKL